MLLLLLFGRVVVWAQYEKTFFRNYNDTRIYNPIWTCYHLFQDSAGFIWSSGPAGLVRFDGHRSKSHANISQGISEMGHIKGIEDEKGRLWFISLNGMLSYYENGSFQVFEGHDSIKMLLSRNKCVSLQVDSQDVLHLGTHGNGYFQYQQEEGLVPIMTEKSHSRGVYVGKLGKVPFVFSILDSEEDQLPISIFRFKDDNGLIVKKIGEMPLVDDLLEHQGHFDIRYTERANGDLLMSVRSFLFEVKEDRVLAHKTSVQMTGLLEDAYGGIWLSNANEKGVHYIPDGDLRSENRHVLLPDVHVHSLTVDKNAGVWLGTRNSGLYHAAYPYCDVYDLPTSYSDVSKVFELDSAFFFSSKEKGVFHAFDGEQMYSFRLNGANDFIKSIVHDERGKRLLMGCDDEVFVFENNNFRRFQHPDFDFVMTVNQLKVIDSSIWVSTRRRLLLMENDSVVYQTPYVPALTRDFCFFQDTLYVGTEEGLWKLDGDRWVDMSDLHDGITGRCEHLRVYNHALWVFNFQKGCFLYKNNKVEEVLDPYGYPLRATGNTIPLNESMLTTSTASCLIEITPNADSGGYTSTAIPGAHHSSYLMVSQMKILDDKVVLLSGSSLYTYDRERILKLPKVGISLENFSANGRYYKAKTAYVLPNDSNNISISFAALNFHGRGLWHYKYRIQPDQAWSQTLEGRAGLNILPPGQYNFEVFAVNLHHQKSPTLTIPISILPPFYETWWFKVLCVLIVGLVIWLWFRWRIGQVRKQGVLLEELYSSQHQALAARMNPHFIFNSLSAIHQFTLENNKDEAAEYMSEYAQLMRLVMENAGQVLVDVQSELEAIYIYLSLERLRSQNRIEYEVQIEKGFDPTEAFIPALLIWPYLENAIWHGLMPKMEGEVLLQLRFKSLGKGTRIEIEDSGIGREKAATLATGNHPGFESVGMSITQSRVDLIQKLYKVKIKIQTFDLEDTLGNASGTRVVLDIPMFS